MYSRTCGGGGISSTFGAALWVLDYTLQSLVVGVQALNFHHGTVGNSPYDWWGALLNTTTNTTFTPYTFAPYYGAVFASAALAGGDTVAMLDDGTTPYAAYAVYDKHGKPLRVVLYNSVYYNGTAKRSHHVFTLEGLEGTSLTAVRLTSAAATDKVETSQTPSVAGLQFDDVTCAVKGHPVVETVKVKDGVANVHVKASQAVLVELMDRGVQWNGNW